MTRSGRPQNFRPFRAPRAPVTEMRLPSRRGDPAARGLGHRHRVLAEKFKRAHPFCRMCEQEGRNGVPAEIADHILPRAEYPHLALEWSNLQGLCRHHDGVKQAMEVYARAEGCVEELLGWCSSLESRPLRFRPAATT